MTIHLPDSTARRGQPATGLNLGLGPCQVPGARSMPASQLKQALSTVSMNGTDPHGLIWALALRRSMGMGSIRILGANHQVAIMLRGQLFWRGQPYSVSELAAQLGHQTARLHPLAPESECTQRPEFQSVELNEAQIKRLSRRVTAAIARVISEDQQSQRAG